MPHLFVPRNTRLRSRGLRGLGCISVTDLTSKCGGYSNNCNPRDTQCVANAAAINSWAQDTMYQYGWPNTCIPDDLPCPNLSSAQQQQITQAFMNNSPIDLATGQAVNPNAPQGSGVVPGVNAPIFTMPVAPPKTAPAPVALPLSGSPAAASSPAAALQQAAASVSPSSSPSDFLSAPSFGGIPTWGLIAGGGVALLLLMSMGGRH